MAADKKDGFSIKRWSQRKLEAARAAEAPAAVPTVPPPPAAALPAAAPATAPAPSALPPVESLTFESDFGAFLQPKVDESLKRAALKKLFSDPHFNVMDGLDTYIDDYTKSDPLPPGMLERLVQGRRIFEQAAPDPAVPTDGETTTAPSSGAAPAALPATEAPAAEPAPDPVPPDEAKDTSPR